MRRRRLALLLADDAQPDAAPPDERQRTVVRALHAAGPAVPRTLAWRIAAETRRAQAEPRPLPAALRRARSARLSPRLLAPVGAVAALAAALLFALSSLSGSPPSALAVAGVGLRAAAEPPPPAARGHPELLARDFAGVEFPNWGPAHGWHAAGARADRVDGRRTSTVFYAHQGHRIAYTVVDGDPLEPPAGARRLVVNGVELHALRLAGGREAVMFRRNGATCVLAGHVIERGTLRRLAAWKGGGEVRF